MPLTVTPCTFCFTFEHSRCLKGPSFRPFQNWAHPLLNVLKPFRCTRVKRILNSGSNCDQKPKLVHNFLRNSHLKGNSFIRLTLYLLSGFMSMADQVQSWFSRFLNATDLATTSTTEVSMDAVAEVDEGWCVWTWISVCLGVFLVLMIISFCIKTCVEKGMSECWQFIFRKCNK